MRLHDLQPKHVYRIFSPYEEMTILVWPDPVAFEKPLTLLRTSDEFMVVSSAKIQSAIAIQRVQILGCNREFLGWLHAWNESLEYEEVLPDEHL